MISPSKPPMSESRCDAYFSPDRKYRYWLLRVWDEALPIMGNIGNNPSTADERENDPTIRKDIGFATRLGFGGLLKLNAGAYRSTDPKKWLEAADPFGPENTAEHLKQYLAEFKTTLTAVTWGKLYRAIRGESQPTRSGAA